jgi:uncharacterized protein
MTTDARIVESRLDPTKAVVDQICPAGEPWLHRIEKGQVLRILDLEGNQAVDTLFYNAHDPRTATARWTRSSARPRCTWVWARNSCPPKATSCSPSSPIPAAATTPWRGLCARATPCATPWRSASCTPAATTSCPACSTTTRPLEQARHRAQHQFLHERAGHPEGGLTFADGISAPGKYVEIACGDGRHRLISNCPQLNNPCNAYNPTPVRLLIWDPQ